MKKETLDRACQICGWLLTVLVFLCALLLIVSCVSISLSGDSPYTRERVAAALAGIAVPLWLTVAVILISAALHVARFFAHGEGHTAVRGDAPLPPPRVSPRGQMLVRVGLLVAALALITLGICNGSMQDVLEKAVRICTECIGLG